MHKTIVFLIMIILILFTFHNFSQQDNFPILRGPYLGQKPPGMTPEVFAPGIVSTGASEFGSTFTPDGNAFYYAISGVPQTPDEKYFFFMSKRRRTEKEYFEPPLTYEQKMKLVNSWGNGEGDIYWVDAKILKSYK